MTDIKLVSCNNENVNILVCDYFKSTSVFNYNISKNQLIEQAKDFSPNWVTTGTFYSKNEDLKKQFFICADTDNNIIVFRQNETPKSDDELNKLEKVGFINIGEKINRFRKHNIINNKSQQRVKFASLNSEVNYASFVTREGTIGVIIELNKKDFHFLNSLQTEILKYLVNVGGFEYSKFRSFKDGYYSDNCQGFVDSYILNEFLLLNENMKKSVLDGINFPLVRSVKEVELIIESLNEFI